MANILRRCEYCNPLANLDLLDDLKDHNSCKTDEELAWFYHRMLDKAEEENRPIISHIIFQLIMFSTDFNVNTDWLLACS